MALLRMLRVPHAPRGLWTTVHAAGADVHARAWFGRRAGDGGDHQPPVVLVHGLAVSSRYLVPLGRRLSAAGYDVLAPDLPGFGRSPRPRGARWPAGSNVREQADQLLMWMDACGIRRAVLFGSSLGAQVVVDLAARFPRRVHRLVLKGPTTDPRYRSVGRAFARIALNMLFEPPSFNALLPVEYASTGPARMAQQGVRSVDDPVEAKLPDVAAPTLVIRGRHDRTISHAWAERVARLLPDGRLVVVEGAAHNVHFVAPHLTAQVITAFLDGRMDDAARAGGGEVVPRLDQRCDPLAPPKPLSTLAHGLTDYAAAVLFLALPRVLRSGPRTRRLMTAIGASGAARAVLTDYEFGAVRRLPMPLHLNADAADGIGLLLASGTWLRGEPLPGRWAVAAMGAYELLAAAATRMPAGPARLVPVARPQAT